MKTKICPHCKIEKSIDFFYKRRNNKNCAPYCKECTSIQTLQRQQQFKLKCMEYKGGKCQLCNYDKYQGALEFHHLDPNEKDFNISKARLLTFSLEIKKELDKCILLCANCHREVHNDPSVLNALSN